MAVQKHDGKANSRNNGRLLGRDMRPMPPYLIRLSREVGQAREVVKVEKVELM